MKRIAMLAAITGATIVAWLLLSSLHPAARVWAALLLVLFPAMMVRQAYELRHMPALPRVPAYFSSIISLWVLCGATLAMCLMSGLDARDLGIRDASVLRIASTSIVITAAAIGLLFAFRALGVRETPVLRELLPVTYS